MIKNLYPFARDWSAYGSVWILSDLHFNDPDCKLMDPNWISPEEQVKRINNLCGINDTFICLGDVGDLSFVKQLNAGTKILIKGNHDSGTTNYLRSLTVNSADTDGEAKEIVSKNKFNKNSKSHVSFLKSTYILDNCLFDEVYSGPLFISDKIVLSHSPLNFEDDQDCFLNIHGHEHTYIDRPNHINMAANLNNYYPINLGRLIKNGSLKDIKNINKAVTAKAVEKRNNEEN